MSKRPQPRPASERAAAAARLAKERLFTLADLRDVAGVSREALQRWALEGRSGVYLDAVRHPEKGWCSSVEAVRRFFKALELVRSMAAKGGA